MPYYAQTSEYISQANGNVLGGNIRINSTGDIYIFTESSFKDTAISEDTLRNMVKLTLFMSDDYSSGIEKVAHGRLLENDELVQTIVERKTKAF